MDAQPLTAAVRRELLAHPGVTENTHRFGGVVFHVGGHEIGHLHGETEADLPLPAHIRDELVASGRLAPVHLAPDSAWVTRHVSGPQDIAAIVELFRISYEHAAAQPPLARAEEDGDAGHDAERGTGPTWRDVLPPPLRRRIHRR